MGRWGCLDAYEGIILTKLEIRAHLDELRVGFFIRDTNRIKKTCQDIIRTLSSGCKHKIGGEYACGTTYEE